MIIAASLLSLRYVSSSNVSSSFHTCLFLLGSRCSHVHLLNRKHFLYFMAMSSHGETDLLHVIHCTHEPCSSCRRTRLRSPTKRNSRTFLHLVSYPLRLLSSLFLINHHALPLAGFSYSPLSTACGCLLDHVSNSRTGGVVLPTRGA